MNTPNTPDQIVEVVTAFKQGKQIECCSLSPAGKWVSVSFPVWNFNDYCYRVKKEPITIYINRYPGDVWGQPFYEETHALQHRTYGGETLKFVQQL